MNQKCTVEFKLTLSYKNYKSVGSSSYPQLDSHCDGPTPLKLLEEGAWAFLLQDLKMERDNRGKQYIKKL